MKVVKNIFKKDTLVEIAGITAGTLTADVVNTQVTPRILKSAQAQKFAPAIPLATGLVLSGSGKKFLKTTGYGMIANAMSSLAKTYLPQTVKSTVGIDGIGQVMMSGVDTPLMGTMDSDGFDYSAQPGGEMDY
jgi:hypothetical protein